MPCWVDTDQPEVDPARRFYGDLFGWKFEDGVPAGAPGTYLIASLGGKDVAAIGPAERGAGAEWNTYIAVDDADAAAASVRKGYGNHLEATVDPGIRDRQAGVTAPPGFEDAIAWLVPLADRTADRCVAECEPTAKNPSRIRNGRTLGIRTAAGSGSGGSAGGGR